MNLTSIPNPREPIADVNGMISPSWYRFFARKVASSTTTTIPTTVTLKEIAAASVTVPSAGSQTLFIDSADHKLKRKDSTGAVTTIA